MTKLQLAFKSYRLPFRVPVNTAHGPWVTREGVLLRVTTEGGVSALAEVAPIPWFGTETVAKDLECLNSLGETPSLAAVTEVADTLPCLKHAFAMTLRRLGLSVRKRPLHEPAATKESVSPSTPDAPVHKYLTVAALLPAGVAAIERARQRAEVGFRTFKWKVGVGDVGDELAILDDLLAALPEGAQLRLDANGAWDRRRAERWLARCAERPIEFVEQPVAADAKGAEDLLLGLCGDFPVKLGLDESLVSEADFERWTGLGWPGVYVVKPSLLADPWGRVKQLRRIGADLVFSSALETRVGALAGLELAFAQEGRQRALGYGVWPLFGRAPFEGPEAAPFIRAEDLARINVEDTWNALS